MFFRRVSAAALAALAAACSPAPERVDPAAQPGDSAASPAAGADASPRQNASPAADSSARISGVGGVPWGATAADVVARRGEPEARLPDAEGVETLGYKDVLAGQPVSLMFFVHPREGLFRGGYMADIGSVAQCSSTLGLFDQGVSRRYPDVPTHVKPEGTVGDPCPAYAQGTGLYMKTWTDVAGNRIWLTLLPGSPAVVLTYTTPAADAWERRKTQAQF